MSKKKSANFKVNSWSQLISMSIKLNTENEQYLIPMGLHGLNQTKVVLDADDEIYQSYKHYDEDKWNRAGTIMLIGTNY